jgi:hypothetical protein
MVRFGGCLSGQQSIGTQPCLVADAPKQICRRGMHAVHKIRNRRLAHANAFGECLLTGMSAMQVRSQRFHSPESIGLPYEKAIGRSYGAQPHNWDMAKPRERTFLERALEALKDRYPRERPTQTRLAKITGVSQPAVFEWGLPGRAPDHAKVLKLATELNVCVEWLYTERGPKHPQKSADSAEPFLRDWDKLEPELRRQIAKYADFIKTEHTKQ